MTLHFGGGRQGQGHRGGKGHLFQGVEEDDGTDGEEVGDVAVGFCHLLDDVGGYGQLLSQTEREGEI